MNIFPTKAGLLLEFRLLHSESFRLIYQALEMGVILVTLLDIS
jgi:hypothetical protein